MATAVKDLEVLKIEEFALLIRGKLTLPKDSDYDEERKVYNGMINKHPGMLVK
ncbi:MAG: oxidoreductase, partial [Arenibacter sp.]|nr:oxidoreductase [Arenibacter sp.]